MSHLTDFDRAGRLTASQCAAAVGLCKFTSRQKLWRICTGKEPKFDGNAYTQYGNDNEHQALSALEAVRGIILDKGRFVPHPTLKWLGASPDGFHDGYIVEAKCPQTLHLECPEHYKIQMYVQMACCSVDKGIFVSWVPHGTYVTDVWFDERYWNEYLMPGLDLFWNHYVANDVEPKRGKFNIEEYDKWQALTK